MTDITNLKDTIQPKSNQLNSDDLLAGPMTITVTEVARGDTNEQPVVVNYESDNGRPYKPCKSMRRVLIFAWGEDGSQWVGRSMTLYNKADVKFGGVEVGGIRISHLSHIDSDIKLSLTATKGKKDQFVIKRLVITDPTQPHRDALAKAAQLGTEALKAAWGKVPKPMQKAIGGCPDELKQLAAQLDAAQAQAQAPAPSSQPVIDPETGEVDPPPAAPQAPAGGDDDDVF